MTTSLRAAFAALLVVVGIGAGAWFHSYRPAVGRPDGVPVPAGQASAPNPSDLAQTPSTAEVGSAAKIPDQLPQFALLGRDGKSTSIAAFSGKSLVINFWATWCAPCQREIPLLQSLHAEWADRNVEVIGVAVDFRDKVLEFADRFHIAYPLLIGEQDALDAAAAFGVDSPVFPFTVFTDHHGQVVALYVGELHRNEADLILSVVQQLDHDALRLPQARQAIAAGLHAMSPQTTG
jgi:peroxiredoxin